MPAYTKDRPKDPREKPRQLQGEELARQRARLRQQVEQVARHNNALEKERGEKVADLASDAADFFHRMHRQEQDGVAIRGSLEDANEAYRKQVGEDNLPPRSANGQRPAWLTGQPRR